MIHPWNALSALREIVDIHERTSADVIAMLATRFEGRRLGLPIDGRRLEGLRKPPFGQSLLLVAH